MPVEQGEKTVILTHESGATAEIYYFGATVTSWKVQGKERLFLSGKSSLDCTKPVGPPGAIPEIRGGIPVVFPIFGAPPDSPPEYASLKQHGFARTSNWTVDSIVMDNHAGVSVRFSSPPPPKEFGDLHKYKLSYVVTLTSHQLSTDMHITNTGTEDFKFQALLHTYLAVPHAGSILINGLDKGVSYKDKVLGFKQETWEGGVLTIPSETDRVFEKVPSQEIHVDDAAGAGYKVRFRGFEDCTIWNPAEEKGKAMPDMEDGGWNKYICIEPGYVREFKTLKAGEEFLGQQIITAL